MYTYYVVYCGEDDNGQFIRANTIFRYKEIKDMDDIESIVNTLQKKQKCHNVVILNWKLLERGTE